MEIDLKEVSRTVLSLTKHNLNRLDVNEECSVECDKDEKLYLVIKFPNKIRKFYIGNTFMVQQLIIEHIGEGIKLTDNNVIYSYEMILEYYLKEIEEDIVLY